MEPIEERLQEPEVFEALEILFGNRWSLLLCHRRSRVAFPADMAG